MGDMDDEAKEQIKKHHDQMHQNHDVKMHAMRQFIMNELTDAQLDLLVWMLNGSAENPVFSRYINGMIDVVRDNKSGICAACNKNHDAELHSFSKDPEPVVEDKAQVPEPHPRQREIDKLNIAWMSENGPFVCKGCGTEYKTIEDRIMAHEMHGGCPVCVKKQKWG
jgi:hypothetical protein